MNKNRSNLNLNKSIASSLITMLFQHFKPKKNIHRPSFFGPRTTLHQHWRATFEVRLRTFVFGVAKHDWRVGGVSRLLVFGDVLSLECFGVGCWASLDILIQNAPTSPAHHKALRSDLLFATLGLEPALARNTSGRTTSAAQKSAKRNTSKRRPRRKNHKQSWQATLPGGTIETSFLNITLQLDNSSPVCLRTIQNITILAHLELPLDPQRHSCCVQAIPWSLYARDEAGFNENMVHYYCLVPTTQYFRPLWTRKNWKSIQSIAPCDKHTACRLASWKLPCQAAWQCRGRWQPADCQRSRVPQSRSTGRPSSRQVRRLGRYLAKQKLVLVTKKSLGKRCQEIEWFVSRCVLTCGPSGP